MFFLVIQEFLTDLLPERNQGQQSHLEMLEAERDSDDCDAEENAEGKVEHGDFNSSYKNPYHIHDD